MNVWYYARVALVWAVVVWSQNCKRNKLIKLSEWSYCLTSVRLAASSAAARRHRGWMHFVFACQVVTLCTNTTAKHDLHQFITWFAVCAVHKNNICLAVEKPNYQDIRLYWFFAHYFHFNEDLSSMSGQESFFSVCFYYWHASAPNFYFFLIFLKEYTEGNNKSLRATAIIISFIMESKWCRYEWLCRKARKKHGTNVVWAWNELRSA